MLWSLPFFSGLFQNVLLTDGWRRPKDWLYDDTSPDVVLLSGHVGSQFWGLGPLLRRNKRLFAQSAGVPHVAFLEEMVTDDTWAPWLEFDEGDLMKYQASAAASRRLRPTCVVWVDGDTWLNPAAKSWTSYAETSCCGAAKLVVGIDTGVISLRQGSFAEDMLALLLAQPGKLNDQGTLYAHYFRNRSWPAEIEILPLERSSLLQCRAGYMYEGSESFKCTADSWISHWVASQWQDLVVHALDHQMSVSDSLAGIGFADYTKRCLEGSFCSAALSAFTEFCDLVSREPRPRLHTTLVFMVIVLLVFRYELWSARSKKKFGMMVGRLRAFAQLFLLYCETSILVLASVGGV